MVLVLWCYGFRIHVLFCCVLIYIFIEFLGYKFYILWFYGFSFMFCGFMVSESIFYSTVFFIYVFLFEFLGYKFYVLWFLTCFIKEMLKISIRADVKVHCKIKFILGMASSSGFIFL